MLLLFTEIMYIRRTVINYCAQGIVCIFSTLFTCVCLSMELNQTSLPITFFLVYCLFSHSVMSDSLWPHGLSLPGSPVHGIFPGKNTGMGYHFLLQGISPTQGLNLHLLHCKWILYRWATFVFFRSCSFVIFFRGHN